MVEQKKTHTLAKNPQISIRHLADYMAASEQVKRTIVQGCKYRPHARVIQHDEAKAIIANFMRSDKKNVSELKEKAAFVRKKLAEDDFEADVNGHNADYIERFASVFETLAPLPDAVILPGKKLAALNIHGVKVTFVPDLLLQRTTKTNKLKSGAVMLRYAKGKELPKATGEYQSAAIHGYLRTVAEATASEVELSLCITLDAFAGKPYIAPGDSIYRFNNMKAACQTIAERWAAIPPPKGAIY